MDHSYRSRDSVPHPDSKPGARSHSRSRSPDRKQHRHHRHHHRHHHRRRPENDRHHRRHRRRHSAGSHSGSRHAAATAPVAVVLPFKAQEITKHDIPYYRPLFGMYLDIQKGVALEDLDVEEVKGRWKSFMGKW